MKIEEIVKKVEQLAEIFNSIDFESMQYGTTHNADGISEIGWRIDELEIQLKHFMTSLHDRYKAVELILYREFSELADI